MGTQKNAEGIEGDPESVTRLAQERGFDKCPVCWTLVVKDAILTECAHKFCEPCLATLATQAFSFSCPSCRTLCLSVKTIPATTVYRETKQFTCPGEECPDVPVMTLGEFDDHIRRKCPSRSIECECGILIKSSRYAHHRDTVHPKTRCPVCKAESFKNLPHLCLKELVACANCGRDTERQELEAHLKVCPLRPTACKTCGLPGPRKVISTHEAECTLELCPYCTRLFRADKFRLHSCQSAPVACPLSECSFEGYYESLGRHMASHPQLVDTGIFSETVPTIYAVSDEKNPTETRFGRKTGDQGEKLTLMFFGDGTSEVFRKDSPRLGVLTEVLSSHYSLYSLHRLFADLNPTTSIRALFTRGRLTHQEAEIISQLEIQYKYQVHNTPSFGPFNFLMPNGGSP